MRQLLEMKVGLDNHKNNHKQNIKKEKNINQTSSIEKLKIQKLITILFLMKKIVKCKRKL